MNTNVKTTLGNLLAPIMGSNQSGKGQNGALAESKGGNDFNNSEFAAIVRQIKSQQEKSDETSTPQMDSDNESQQDDLGYQISTTLSQMIQNKPVKEQNTESSEIETVLSEIAALVQANPEQFQDAEALQSTIQEFLPENSEKLQEISNFLAGIQQNAIEANAEQSGVVTPEVTVETTENTSAITQSGQAEAVIDPALAESMVNANQQSTSETTDGKAAETLTQNDAVIAKKAEIPQSNLNSATLDTAQSGSQSNSSSGQESKGLSAEQLLEMVQDTESEAAENETPLRQTNLSPEKILAKDAQTGKNPISTGSFKAEMDAAEYASPDNTAAEKSVTDTSPNIFNASSVKTAESSNADIARQIQETITTSYRSDSKQVVIRLDPPELGKVTIQFIEKSDGITGVLQVDQAQTRQDIERALPEIIQNLQNANVQVKKVEVVTTSQQQGYDTSRDESAFSQQEGGFDQQNNPHSSAQNTGYHEPGGQFENFDGSDQSDMQMTEKSINMLI